MASSVLASELFRGFPADDHQGGPAHSKTRSGTFQRLDETCEQATCSRIRRCDDEYKRIGPGILRARQAPRRESRLMPNNSLLVLYQQGLHEAMRAGIISPLAINYTPAMLPAMWWLYPWWMWGFLLQRR